MPPKTSELQKKKAAKKGSAKTAKSTAKDLSGGHSGADELDSIFSALNRKKNAQAADGAATSANAPTPSSTIPAHRAQRMAVAADERAARPRRDGLYREPEKSMHMNDLGFFGGTVRGGRMMHDAAVAGSAEHGEEAEANGDDDAAPEVTEAVLRQEGVDRIVSMNQLRKMLSRNPNAGSTPNCPFDCDCCF